jgi:hypothetical protein
MTSSSSWTGELHPLTCDGGVVSKRFLQQDECADYGSKRMRSRIGIFWHANCLSSAAESDPTGGCYSAVSPVLS